MVMMQKWLQHFSHADVAFDQHFTGDRQGECVLAMERDS